MPIAHLLGLPAEELLLPVVSGGSTILLALRVWIDAHARGRGRRRGR